MIVIVDYKMGNLRSVYRKIEHMGIKTTISSNLNVIRKADKLILPGVGNFAQAMKNLNKSGLIPVLNQKVIKEKVPILGICLGMQMLTNQSEEGNIKGLGWIEAETKRFNFKDQKLRIPHMGWNRIKIQKRIPLLENIKNNTEFYFVHTYHVIPQKKSEIIATTDYGPDFVSVIAKNNIIGVQFHPEKSRMDGVRLLKNFARNEGA